MDLMCSLSSLLAESWKRCRDGTFKLPPHRARQSEGERCRVWRMRVFFFFSFCSLGVRLKLSELLFVVWECSCIQSVKRSREVLGLWILRAKERFPSSKQLSLLPLFSFCMPRSGASGVASSLGEICGVFRRMNKVFSIFFTVVTCFCMIEPVTRVSFELHAPLDKSILFLYYHIWRHAYHSV